MSQKINLIQNDNNIKLIFNITKDGRVESIIGATILLELKNTQSGKVISNQCVITDPTTAECMYILKSSDTSEAGGYISEITITYSNGTVLRENNPIILIIAPQSIL